MTNCNFNNLFVLIVSFFLYSRHLCSANDLKSCKFDQIYQLGDSYSDTGNYIRESSKGAASAFAKLPYGETFFKKPTGRCSNGRLIIDYIASSSGLPFVNPTRNIDRDTRNGDNFATIGATALPEDFLAGKNISSPYTSTSLDVQLDLMFTHFNGICIKDCTQLLKTALFMIGQIGMNDYNFALLQGKTIPETLSLVSDVVSWIQKAIKRVIDYGAIRIVVPGIIPLGCLPAHLTKFQTNNSSAYNVNNCLKNLNTLSENHNQQLQRAIAEVQNEQKNVTIVYGDNYKAYLNLLGNKMKAGGAINLQQDCCGTGGKYNFSFNKMCGGPGVHVCAQPDNFINWDGIHLTEHAYGSIAQSLIDDILPKLKCNA